MFEKIWITNSYDHFKLDFFIYTKLNIYIMYIEHPTTKIFLVDRSRREEQSEKKIIRNGDNHAKLWSKYANGAFFH